MDGLGFVALGAALFSLAWIALGVVALRRRRWLGAAASFLLMALGLAFGALFLTLSIATQGYRALVREDVVATAELRPLGPQRFSATLVYPDGERRRFTLNGDQLYVDAHILKWKPVANLLGLHTAYELDRIGGRFHALEEERARDRTLYSLKTRKTVDVFALRQEYRWLAPLLDAEYGSATFVSADGPSELELRVSTTGLLFRPVESAQ